MYEPNDTVSNELVDSQGPFSYVTPSSDQDIDDTTLGKLLTEAHREYADYLSLEGVFVSQSSVSVASDRTWKPVGKSNIDPFSFGVRNAYSAHNQFLAITQAEKWSIERGNPWERAIPVRIMSVEDIIKRLKRLSQALVRCNCSCQLVHTTKECRDYQSELNIGILE